MKSKEDQLTIDTVIAGIFSSMFFSSVLRITSPIIFPSLGGLITDLAGSMNIALEGTMLASAFVGVIVSAFTKNIYFGLIAGIVIGVITSLFVGYIHLYLKTNIVLVGIATNILWGGLTILLLYQITGDKGSSANLASGLVPNVSLPIIRNIPFVGEVISDQPIFTYLAFILALVVSILLYKTRFGVHLRAVGEHPQAAASMEIDVIRTKMIAFAMSGFLAALGGLNLSMAYLPLFLKNMSAGRGFIALAAISLGRRRPWGTVAACFIFGFADALSNHLGSLNIPSQMIQSLPYVATIIALVLDNLIIQIKSKNKITKHRNALVQEIIHSSN